MCGTVTTAFFLLVCQRLTAPSSPPVIKESSFNIATASAFNRISQILMSKIEENLVLGTDISLVALEDKLCIFYDFP